MFANIYNKIAFGLIVLFVLIVMPVYSKGVQPESVLNKNKASIVKIFSKHKKHFLMGLGFIIHSEGLVLTNDHIVGSQDFILQGPENKTYEVEKIVFRDKKSDLVLLKISSEEPLSTVKLGNSSSLKIGDKLVTVNLIAKDEYLVSNSVVKKIVHTPTTGDSVILIENPYNIPNFMEGSPVFDQAEDVVGVLSSANDDRSILGLTITPINELHGHKVQIKEFLKDYNTSKKFVIKGDSFPEKDKKVVVEEDKKPEKVEKPRKKRRWILWPKKSKKEKQESIKQNQKEIATKTVTTKKVVKPEIKEDKQPEKVETDKPSEKAEKPKKKRRWILWPKKSKKNKQESIKQNQKEVQSKTVATANTEPATPIMPLKPKVSVKPKDPVKPNNFGINLTGYWFDLITGHNIYLENKGDQIVMHESQSGLSSTNKKTFNGTFKRDGNKYAGVIEGTIDCKDDMTFKKAKKQDMCLFSEEAELVDWDQKSIQLNVNTINEYSCKKCVNTDQKTWKSRMWLRKNKKN